MRQAQSSTFLVGSTGRSTSWPTAVRNSWRRSAGSTDRSRARAPMPLRNDSLASSVLIDPGESETGGVVSYFSRVMPSPASTSNSPSNSLSKPGVTRCATRPWVSRSAAARAVATCRARDHTRPHHPRRDQVLTRQPEQQRRRIMLHRPGQQELIQLLPLQHARRPPAQIPGHLLQMPGPGLLPPAVRRQLAH